MLLFLKLQFIELQKSHFLVHHPDQTKSHDGGSRVYAQYDFLGIQKLRIIAGLLFTLKRRRRFLKNLCRTFRTKLINS